MSKRDGRGRFKPGASGNPKGRPVDSSIKDRILAELAAAHGTSGITRMEAFAKRLVDLCIEGDVEAMRMVLDRGWPAKLELGGESLVKLQVIDYSDRREDDHPSGGELNRGRAVRDFEAPGDQPPGYYDPHTPDRERLPEPPAPVHPSPPPAPALTIQRPWLDRGGMQTTAE